MSATGGTDDHFDPQLDAYQVLGVVPPWVLDCLWPGFVPQTHEVSIDPVHVRRHMQKAPEYLQRVASFAQHAHELPGLFARHPAGQEWRQLLDCGADIFVTASLRLRDALAPRPAADPR